MWMQLLPFYCYYSIQSQMHTDKISFEYIKSKIFLSCNAALYNRSWLEKDNRWQQVGGWPFLALAAKQGQVWLAMWKGNLEAKVPCKISWEISRRGNPTLWTYEHFQTVAKKAAQMCLWNHQEGIWFQVKHGKYEKEEWSVLFWQSCAD